MSGRYGSLRGPFKGPFYLRAQRSKFFLSFFVFFIFECLSGCSKPVCFDEPCTTPKCDPSQPSYTCPVPLVQTVSLPKDPALQKLGREMASLAREHHALKERLVPDGHPCPSPWTPTEEDILYAASWLQAVNQLTDSTFTKKDLQYGLAKHLNNKNSLTQKSSNAHIKKSTTNPQCPSPPTSLEKATILLQILGF